MKSLQADVLSRTLLFDPGHELAGWLDAVVSDESADLHPERNKGDQINQPEGAQKNPACVNIIRQFDMPTP